MWLIQAKETKTVNTFKEYTTLACDAFNACRYSIAKMTAEADANSTSKFMLDFLGEGEDLRTWVQLHETRKELLGEVIIFAEETMAKMETVKKRMKNRKQFKSFQDCYEGYSSEDSVIKAKALKGKSIELRQEIVEFYEKVQNERRTTIQKERFKQIVAGFLVVTGACCGMALMAANPAALTTESVALRIGAASILDRAFETSTVLVSKSLAALPKNGNVDQFTKDEIERAVAFLQNLETSPIDSAIQSSMKEVYTSTSILSPSERTQCERLVDKVILECQKISQSCKSCQLYVPGDGDGASNDHDKIKKSVGVLLKVAQVVHSKKTSGAKK
mmetsp:Transcript_15980/g.20279  ORF Transcript_15980/g.20279 Transcript_15980/m.20279 type:complete len:332 (-) Transcript_15980:113-1108(-)